MCADKSFLDSGFQVILTGEVSGDDKPRIFVSDDSGKTFTHHDLNFMPLTQMSYNPEDSNVLFVFSSKVSEE